MYSSMMNQPGSGVVKFTTHRDTTNSVISVTRYSDKHVFVRFVKFHWKPLNKYGYNVKSEYYADFYRIIMYDNKNIELRITMDDEFVKTLIIDIDDIIL